MFIFRFGREADSKSIERDSAVSEAPFESCAEPTTPLFVLYGMLSNLSTHLFALFGSLFPDMLVLKLIAISVPPYITFQLSLEKLS
jgi:hypothetical protein